MQIADNCVSRRRWDNQAWENCCDLKNIQRRNWNNSGWETGTGDALPRICRRIWNNSGWEQIYPKGIIEVTPGEVVTYSGGMHTRQYKYSTWNSGYARQGWCIKSGGGGEQFGLIVTGKSFEGAGSIISPGTATFAGYLGSSGNYNAVQTISFRGTNHGGPSGNPFGSHDHNSPFTYSWKARGAESEIPRGNIQGNLETMKRWMNNEYRNLCVYNGETNGAGSYESTYSANYLNIKRMNLQIHGYTYMSRMVMFDRPENAAKVFGFNDVAKVPKDEDYIKVAIPDHLSVKDAAELINLLETEAVMYRRENDMHDIREFSPAFMEMDIEENLVRISHMNTSYTDVEYKLPDCDKWAMAICVAPMVYSVARGAERVRIRETQTDEVYTDMIFC